MKYEYMVRDNMSVLYAITKRKRLSNIVGIRIVGGKTYSSLWLILREVIYENCG
jgi:hypothetical protein